MTPTPILKGGVLMAAFAALLLLVGGVMVVRQFHHHTDNSANTERGRRPGWDDPIITFSPMFACQCPRALKVLITATVVGLLTGFLGVGGGFLVVPALLLALALPMQFAAGTSLVVITITSTAALAVRAANGVTQPDWGLVAALTLASAVAAIAGARLAAHANTDRLSFAFTALVLAVASYTAIRAVPALI